MRYRRSSRECPSQMPHPRRDRGGFPVGPGERGRLRHPQEQRNREHQPPQADARQAQPGAGSGVGQAEHRRPLDHQQVDRQEHASAQEADGIPGGRDAVQLRLPDEMREDRLVEHDAPGHPDIADHEQREPEQPLPFGQPEHREAGGDADAGEDPQQPLLDRRVIGDRPEERSDQGDDEDRDRARPGEPRQRLCLGHVGGEHPAEVDREHRRDDGGLERGIGEVVDRPGPHLRPAEPDSIEEAAQNVRLATHSRSSESTTT